MGPRGSLLARRVYKALTREADSSRFSLLKRGGQGSFCEQDQNMPLKRDQEAAQEDCRWERRPSLFLFFPFHEEYKESSGRKCLHEQPFPFPVAKLIQPLRSSFPHSLISFKMQPPTAYAIQDRRTPPPSTSHPPRWSHTGLPDSAPHWDFWGFCGYKQM